MKWNGKKGNRGERIAFECNMRIYVLYYSTYKLVHSLHCIQNKGKRVYGIYICYKMNRRKFYRKMCVSNTILFDSRTLPLHADYL